MRSRRRNREARQHNVRNRRCRCHGRNRVHGIEPERVRGHRSCLVLVERRADDLEGERMTNPETTGAERAPKPDHPPVPQTEGECPQCGGDGWYGGLKQPHCPTCSGTGKEKA